MQVNYVAAFKEIEFELVCYASTGSSNGGEVVDSGVDMNTKDNGQVYSEAMCRILEYTGEMQIQVMEPEPDSGREGINNE